MSATEQAKHAIRAAKNIHSWGPEAAWRYAERRGVPLNMLAEAIHVEQRRLIRNKAVKFYENAVRVEAAQRGMKINMQERT